MFRLPMVVLSLLTTVSMAVHAIPLSLDLDPAKDFYIAVSSRSVQRLATVPDDSAPAEQEGEIPPEGTARAEQEGEISPEGTAPAEQEGEISPEGTAPAEQEGEIPPEGTAPAEQDGEFALDASADDQLASIDYSLKVLVSLAILAGSILFVWFFVIKPLKYFIDF